MQAHGKLIVSVPIMIGGALPLKELSRSILFRRSSEYSVSELFARFLGRMVERPANRHAQPIKDLIFAGSARSSASASSSRMKFFLLYLCRGGLIPKYFLSAERPKLVSYSNHKWFFTEVGVWS